MIFSQPYQGVSLSDSSTLTITVTMTQEAPAAGICLWVVFKGRDKQSMWLSKLEDLAGSVPSFNTSTTN